MVENNEAEISNQDVDLESGMAAFRAKEFRRAMQLLSPLAGSGNLDAMYSCALMYQNGLGCVVNEEAAFNRMSRAAEQGHPFAQHGLGFMYYSGECVQQDGEKAKQWFTRAAEQGVVGSQVTLANMYREGTIIEQNIELADKLLKEAGF